MLLKLMRIVILTVLFSTFFGFHSSSGATEVSFTIDTPGVQSAVGISDEQVAEKILKIF